MRNIILAFFIVLQTVKAAAQEDSVPISREIIQPIKVWAVGGGQALLWTGTFTALDKAWYAGYPRKSFHLFNDWNEWQQMDKAGHFWTSYQVSRGSGNLWRWTGISENKAAIFGGFSGLAFLSIIEILDGYTNKWGFSWGDMSMNMAGAATYTVQQLVWKEQRIQVKMGYNPYPYENQMKSRSNDLFGALGVEKVLKDYNSQTYWLSANVHAFFPESGFPKWLNIAIGYNARLMLGGTENKWIDKNGTTLDLTNHPRYRRFLLSADIDLTKINTKNKALKTIFSMFNCIKFPLPALELNSKGEIKAYGIYF